MSKIQCEKKREKHQQRDTFFFFLLEHFRSIIESMMHQIGSKQQRTDHPERSVTSSSESIIDSIMRLNRLQSQAWECRLRTSSIGYWCLGCLAYNNMRWSVCNWLLIDLVSFSSYDETVCHFGVTFTSWMDLSYAMRLTCAAQSSCLYTMNLIPYTSLWFLLVSLLFFVMIVFFSFISLVQYESCALHN